MTQKSSITPKTVSDCYGVLDLTIEAGVEDLTEGIYNNDPSTPYQLAQDRQIEYLLDQVGCQAGSRILDIGCGYGTLLEAAKKRGATAVGITIAPNQVERCHQKGLDVHLINYRNLGQEWNGQFDCIVANGSIEHFIQPQDAIAGKADKIYQELFAICRRLFNPDSASKKLVTTVIHFNNLPNMKDMLRSPFNFRWGSDKFHFAFLHQCFGGFYPISGQLQHCAQDFFELECEVDGTYDYHLTSEAWLKRLRKAILTNPRFLSRIIAKGFKLPRHTMKMVLCILVSQSWNWQFRTDNPPTKLLRQTWGYID